MVLCRSSYKYFISFNCVVLRTTISQANFSFNWKTGKHKPSAINNKRYLSILSPPLCTDYVTTFSLVRNVTIQFGLRKLQQNEICCALKKKPTFNNHVEKTFISVLIVVLTYTRHSCDSYWEMSFIFTCVTKEDNVHVNIVLT